MQSRRRFLGAMSVPALSAVAVAVPCKNSNEMQDTVPGGLTVPGFGPPASRGVLSWDGSHRERVRSSGTWNDRVVEADGDLVSDQRVQAINRLGRLVACAASGESQDRAEIDHVLGVSSGQFSVAISARLLSLSLPRLDALSERFKVIAVDPMARTRASSGDHGQPPSRNRAVDPNTYTCLATAQPVKSWLESGAFCWCRSRFENSQEGHFSGALRRWQTKHTPNRNRRFRVSYPPGYDMA